MTVPEACKRTDTITVVALSEAEGNSNSGVPLTSEIPKKYLKTQIAEESVIIPDVEGQEQEQVLEPHQKNMYMGQKGFLFHIPT